MARAYIYGESNQASQARTSILLANVKVPDATGTNK